MLGRHPQQCSVKGLPLFLPDPQLRGGSLLICFGNRLRVEFLYFSSETGTRISSACSSVVMLGGEGFIRGIVEQEKI